MAAAARAQGRGHDSRILALGSRTGTVTRRANGPMDAGALAIGSARVWVISLCAGPKCRVDRASVCAYDARSGRVVCGPFRAACGREGWFVSGIDAGGASASVAVGDGAAVSGSHAS